ncbi:MAG: GTPase EngC [Thermoleophilia bacterium]|nr:GTPase EngC [Thermoleophilia bacterium]
MSDDIPSRRDRVRDLQSSSARETLDAAFARLDLETLGWSRAIRAAPAELLTEHPDATPARVVQVDRGRLLRVATGSAPPVHVRDRTEPRDGTPAVVGDWVLVEPPALDAGGLAFARCRLPRRGELARRDDTDSSHPRIMAANVDLVLVVEALAPGREINVNRVARVAALATASGIDVRVLLTHADTVTDDPPSTVAGHAAIATSIVDGRGLDEVAALLAPGTTATVVGASGAGKSSMVNALAGTDLQAIAETRASGTGRHTTSVARLVPLPGGALLVDTPGVRLVGMHGGVDADDVLPDEVAELMAACRFTNCAHEGEPGCAIAAAIDAGELDEDVLVSWRRLEREALRERARSDAKVRSELRASHRRTGKEVTRARRKGEIVERRRG